MNANTLELKHMVYGFEKEGVEEAQSIDDIDTVVEQIVQAIVWETTDGLRLVKWIGEIALRDKATTYSDVVTLEKATRRLKNLAKNQGVENVRVKPVFSYGGRRYR